MSLRMRLTWALAAAAIGPMMIAVVATWLRAERRADEEASQRIETARRQARILLGRHRDETVARLEQVAAELPYEFSALEGLIRTARPAPVGAGGHDAVAGGTARTGLAPLEIANTLAERRGLDHLEILDAQGTILATSRMDARTGQKSALAGIDETDVVVQVLPEGPMGAAGPAGRRPRAAFLARRSVPIANEPLSVAGGRVIDQGLLDGIAAITGGAAFLIDPSGSVEVRAEPPREGPERPPPAADESGASTDASRARGSDLGGGWISGDEPVGDGGWRVRVTAPAADVQRARSELTRIVFGIAPFALLTALLLGFVLAKGVSRPIRALASRAEEISAQQAAPIRLHSDTDEVRRLTVAFDQMLDALGRSESQRVSAERIAAWQEVAKRIAHEVKNPLSPIKLAVENLLRTREKAPQELDRALTEESATILEEVESLRRLVDEFSQFARLPSPQPSPCDPKQIVASALALHAARIEARGIQVDTRMQDAPSSIRADAEQIGRALKNVLLNALDAMEKSAEPRLTIVLSRGPGRGGENLEIAVTDTGVGMDAETAQRIFEPYFTTRPESGGAGLGMAITHRIVFEHGGSIQASSRPGRGTTITMRLPVAGPPAAI